MTESRIILSSLLCAISLMASSVKADTSIMQPSTQNWSFISYSDNGTLQVDSRFQEIAFNQEKSPDLKMGLIFSQEDFDRLISGYSSQSDYDENSPRIIGFYIQSFF